jgi:hypothetical protein
MLGGVLGKGVNVLYNVDDSPTSYLAIGQLLNVTVPKFVSDRHEITTHDVVGYLKRYMSGLTDVTDVTLELLSDHNPTTSPAHAALRGFSVSKEVIWLRIEIPQDPDLTITKYLVYEAQFDIGEFSIDTPINGPQKTMVTGRFRGSSFTITDDQASLA